MSAIIAMAIPGYAATHEEWLDAAAEHEGAWCCYNNDPANGKKYGRL